jgi:hypothetical protein
MCRLSTAQNLLLRETITADRPDEICSDELDGNAYIAAKVENVLDNGAEEIEMDGVVSDTAVVNEFGEWYSYDTGTHGNIRDGNKKVVLAA